MKLRSFLVVTKSNVKKHYLNEAYILGDSSEDRSLEYVGLLDYVLPGISSGTSFNRYFTSSAIESDLSELLNIRRNEEI
jgi:hypothetical protein